jgi:phosphonate transport system substrate-binding protein
MIRFGITREHSVTVERLGLLCTAAATACEHEVVPIVFDSYDALARGIAHGKTDVVWAPPIAAALWIEEGLVDLMALPLRAGQLTYHAALIMRRGSGRTLDKLRGSRVAWVDRQSASGYLVPRVHLASLGYDPSSFFGQEFFATTHRGVVDAVVEGEVDIGATYCQINASGKMTTAAWTLPDGSSIRPVEIVTSAGPIPNDAIVGTKSLKTLERTRMLRFFLDPTPEGKEALRSVFNTPDFRIAKADHFLPLRHMVRSAVARGHESLLPGALR